LNVLEIAERAAAASRAGGALAHVTRERSLMLRFADNRPTQATSIDDLTVELAVVRDGHVGRASTNDASPAALAECARRAEAAADAAAAGSRPGQHPGFAAFAESGDPAAGQGGRRQGRSTAAPNPRSAGPPRSQGGHDPGPATASDPPLAQGGHDPAAASASNPGSAGPARPPSHRGHDAATAALDPAVGGAALAAVFAVAERRGLAAHGIWSAAEQERAVAVEGGGAALDRTTDAFMKVICIAPDGRSGYASRAAVAAGALEPEQLAERAAGKAAADGEPADLPPGEYPVVMEPHAIGTLLDMLGETALNGLAHAEGRGAFAGRLGARVAAPAVNLADSPFFGATLPRAFDAEGTRKAPLPLIEDGVARAVVHDRRSGALAGTDSTGHARAPGGDPQGPHPVNLVLAGGGADGVEELCAPVERGIYVTRLWYGNVVRPKETLVTAVTRDGTFLIEDGRVTRPLHDLRLTDSVLGMLSRTEALTASQELTSDGEFYGRRDAYGVVCPGARVGAVRFTGPAG
jgi:PmbA protein